MCRCLLTNLDCIESDSHTVTQDLISNKLGVPRKGVIAAAEKLQRDGLISYRRGHIDVLDQPAMKMAVCGCYAKVRAEVDRLLLDFLPQDSSGILRKP